MPYKTKSRETTDRPMSTYIGYCQSPGQPIQEYPSEKLNFINEERFNGISIKDFFAKKKRGDLLPLTQFMHWEMHAEGEVTSEAETHGGLRCWHRHPVTETYEISYASELQYAQTLNSDPYIQQAAAEVYSQFHDTLTFLAEFTKVISMFRNTGKSIVRLLKNKPKGWGYSQAAKDLPSKWLEYRYGWRTLYYDLLSIVEAVNAIDDQRTRYSERAGESWSEVYNSVIPAPAVKDASTLNMVFSREVSLRGSVVADIQPPKFSMNPAVTAWELVTFSFIIDWFLDIGQWLAASSFLVFNAQHYAAGGVKLTSEKRSTYNYYLDPNDPVWKSSTSAVGGYGNAELTTRSPSRVSLTPQIKFDIDTQKVIDMIAIVLTMYLGVKLKGSGIRI